MKLTKSIVAFGKDDFTTVLVSELANAPHFDSCDDRYSTTAGGNQVGDIEILDYEADTRALEQALEAVKARLQ